MSDDSRLADKIWESQRKNFLNFDLWKESQKGNYYRRFPDGSTITLFRQGEMWKFCINFDDDRTHFSKNTYFSEGEAAEGAWYFLQEDRTEDDYW